MRHSRVSGGTENFTGSLKYQDGLLIRGGEKTDYNPTLQGILSSGPVFKGMEAMSFEENQQGWKRFSKQILSRYGDIKQLITQVRQSENVQENNEIRDQKAEKSKKERQKRRRKELIKNLEKD